MATTLDKNEFLAIVRDHDWQRTALVMARYGDKLLRQALVKGAPIGRSATGALTLPDGSTGKDLVGRAVEALLTLDAESERARTWDPQKTPSLDDFLASTIRSLVSNALTRKKDQKTEGQVKYSSAAGEEVDVLANAEDPGGVPQEVDARLAEHRDQIACFRRVLAADKDQDLLALFDCYDAEYTKPRDIEDLTGIPSARVSELKRKHRSRLDDHFLSEDIRAYAENRRQR